MARSCTGVCHGPRRNPSRYSSLVQIPHDAHAVPAEHLANLECLPIVTRAHLRARRAEFFSHHSRESAIVSSMRARYRVVHVPGSRRGGRVAASRMARAAGSPITRQVRSSTGNPLWLPPSGGRGQPALDFRRKGGSHKRDRISQAYQAEVSDRPRCRPRPPEPQPLNLYSRGTASRSTETACRSSSAVQGRARPVVRVRMSLTAAASIGEAVWPHSRRMYVNVAAI